MKIIEHTRVLKTFVTIACILYAGASYCAEKKSDGQKIKINPKIHYIINGEKIWPWVLAVGSKANWHVPLSNGTAKTRGKGVQVTTENDPEKGRVLRVKWRSKKGDNSFQVGGEGVDLKSLEDIGALLIQMKMHKPVKSPVAMSMDCTYPCRGSFQLRPLLKKYPVNEWITLALPLNCFSNAGANLSNVNAPMHIQTAGKMDISISNVMISLLPEGDKGCAE